MTYEEALKVIEKNLSMVRNNWGNPMSEYEIEQAEGLQKAQEAIEKQIEKPVLYYKPKRRAGGQQITPADIPSYSCSCCMNELFEKQAFCGNCGQKLKWSEEK